MVLFFFRIKNQICQISFLQFVFQIIETDFGDESASIKLTDSVQNNNGSVATSDLTSDHVNQIESNQRESFRNTDTSNKCDGCGHWRTKYEEAKKETDGWHLKYDDVKKSMIKLSLKYTDLMMKYEDLVETAKGAVRPKVNTQEISDGESQSSSTSNGESQSAYASNAVSQSLVVNCDIFTESEIKCLQCVSLDKKKDSTFIFNCVQYAYKNDLASLATRTLKGTRGRYEIKEGELVTIRAGKDPLTPEKVQRIQQLFIDRVTRSRCMSAEFGERVRLTNINKLIASAVKNISNREAPTDVQSNENLNL